MLGHGDLRGGQDIDIALGVQIVNRGDQVVLVLPTGRQQRRDGAELETRAAFRWGAARSFDEIAYPCAAL